MRIFYKRDDIYEMIVEIVKIILALGVFFLLACLVIRWALKGIIENLHGLTLEKAKLQIIDLKENALREILNLVSDQQKSVENFIEQKKIELTQSMAAANEDLNQKSKRVEIAFELHWRYLREEYEALDDELGKWEASRHLRRGEQEAETIDELVTYLNNIMINGEKIPEPTIELYRKRHRLFASLARLSQIEKDSAARLPNVDFSLPSSPQLPLTGSTASDGFGMDS